MNGVDRRFVYKHIRQYVPLLCRRACFFVLYKYDSCLSDIGYHSIILSCTPYECPSPPPNQLLSPHSTALPTVELGSDIKIKIQGTPFRPGLRLALVKINYILNLFPVTPLHHPVMPVEWLGIAHQGLHSGLWRDGAGAEAFETQQFRTAAVGRSVAFPCLDQSPGSFVDGVVDWDNG